MCFMSNGIKPRAVYHNVRVHVEVRSYALLTFMAHEFFAGNNIDGHYDTHNRTARKMSVIFVEK